MRQAGRHFLQIPGPSNVPDRILRAMDNAVLDHRGPAFADLGLKVLGGMKAIFNCSGPVVIYPASGTGAWEAALVNTLSPGDKVLTVETGHFASLWLKLAGRLGIDAEILETDWRSGARPPEIEERLRADKAHEIKALCVVHNETSTGATSRIGAVREAMDAAGHPALLLVDSISGLGSAEFKMDEWGVDVAIAGSQKGLMLPPGLSFNALSEKAIAASKSSSLPKSYWAWDEMLAPNQRGYFPYTPATNLLYGLSESLDMLHEEGLPAVYRRHARHGEATRRAVQAWGFETQCLEPLDHSAVLTAVRLPGGYDADALRATILKHFDMSLGNGLSKIAGQVFRIGHLGDFNDLMLMGTLSGIEMGLALADVPHQIGGVARAMDYLKESAQSDGLAGAAE